LLNAQVLWADVGINIRRTHLPPMKQRHQIEAEALLRGESPLDAAIAWSEVRQTRAEPLVTELRDRIVALGGEVYSENLRTGRIEGSVPMALVQTLLEEPQINAIGLLASLTEMVDDTTPAGHWTNVFGFNTHGVEIEDLNQTRQFYDDDYEGQGIGLAMIEDDNLFIDHPGFFDGAGSRRLENNVWNASTSTWVHPSPGHGTPHATAVASIIIGDLTRGQDAAIPQLWQQRMRSGVARRGTLHAYDSLGDSPTVNALTWPGNGYVAVNMSAGFRDRDQTCTGRDVASADNTVANELFESGVTLFKSASNQGNETVWDCRISTPGAAIGAFTVGAYDVTEDGTNTPIRESTSRGGTDMEGRGRTIIGMTTNTRFRFPYTSRTDCDYTYGLGGVPGDPCKVDPPFHFGGTSGAVPIVTGGHAVWESWYADTYGGLDAGSRHALMLLQGDRRSQGPYVPADPANPYGNGSFAVDYFRTQGYDGMWGAGRLRLRRFDSAGMDGPLRWTKGSTCVDDGEFVVIPVTTSDVTSDVDIMKAVTDLYDGRHDSSTDPSDRVDLWLGRELANGSIAYQVIDQSTDNKKRAFIYDPEPGKYYIALLGRDVTSDVEGCGENSTRVWWSYMHEDSDRESHENLTTVRTEDEDDL
jgi:hypothetical protein